MARRRTRNNSTSLQNNSTCGETSPTYSRNIKLIPFLLAEYSGLDFILDLGDSIINLLNKIFKKNKKIQTLFTLLKYAIPVTVFIADFIAKIKKYHTIKTGNNTVTHEHENKIMDLLRINSPKKLGSINFNLGIEVTRWLLLRPKCEIFKIIGYYQYDNLQPLTDTYKEDDTSIFVLIEYKEIQLIWCLRMCPGYEDYPFIRVTDLYGTVENANAINHFKKDVYREFIQHFDTVNNILFLSPIGLEASPRQGVIEETEYDVNNLCVEIRKTLKKKKKRGFAFVGVPGTGKSTIIHRLETLITEYPIIYTGSDCFDGAGVTRDTFETIEYIQPCLVIMEDLDSYNLKDKRAALGEFLEKIDDVNGKINAVFLATINDTSLVHYSLINRPGRFDEVIKINPPQNLIEVYRVMKCRYNKNKDIDKEITTDFINMEDIDQGILQKIINTSYTQADICEIIEKALLIDYNVTNSTLQKSLTNLTMSKQAIQSCNFSGSDPSSYPEDDEITKEATSPIPYKGFIT